MGAKMIFIYGKKGCQKCTAGKDKLRLMGLEYEFVDLEIFPYDWRDKFVADAMAENQMTGSLPLFKLPDDPVIYDYPAAMAILRKRSDDVGTV